MINALLFYNILKIIDSLKFLLFLFSFVYLAFNTLQNWILSWLSDIFISLQSLTANNLNEKINTN